MKNEVLDFLVELPEAQEDQYNKAFALYRRCPDKNPQLERGYNLGFTKNRLSDLMYELKKLVQVSEVDVHAHAQKKKADEEVSSEDIAKCIYEDKILPIIDALKERELWEEGFEEKINAFTEKPTVEGANKLITYFEEVGSKLAIEATEGYTGSTGTTTDTTESSEENTEDKKLREEFPFLNENDCPDVMYIVVGKKIAAWKTYVAAHETLQLVDEGKKELTPEERKEVAKEATESFEENQALYDELNYYAEKKEILGVHPIFKQYQLDREKESLKKEVDAMTGDELRKYVGSSKTYISRKNKAIAKAEKAKDTETISQLKEDLALRQYALGLVNERLAKL
ncbi:hypothetical protein SAMN05216480_10531 [Pustulibacterium marinum]|uniref:Uncharacterized protein n=1 Tax=Pustulibacterium marinum TaxID=1224947 RepID=A0A1I7GKU4_9FLAO|nr:hypothetical protein [Pustulibacterium marinum]SFU48961.1 hypothetical protein SAMN05216480_10531 [Pustulibacterium marinum]